MGFCTSNKDCGFIVMTMMNPFRVENPFRAKKPVQPPIDEKILPLEVTPEPEAPREEDPTIQPVLSEEMELRARAEQIMHRPITDDEWPKLRLSLAPALQPLGFLEIIEPIEKTLASVFTAPFREGGILAPAAKEFFPKGEEFEEYEEWEAPTIHTGFRLPKWLGDEELTLGVKGAVELAPWMLLGGWGGARKTLFLQADKILRKQAAGQALKASEKTILEQALKVESEISRTFIKMPTIEELIAANYNPNIAAKVGQKLTNAPGVIGSLSRSLLPMQTAKTDAEKAVIAWMGQKDIAPSLARIEMDIIYTRDFPFKFAPPVYPAKKLPIKPIEEGLIKNVKPIKPEYKPHIMAIAEFPERYILTDSQKVEINALDRILQEQLARELAAGVKVAPVKLKEGQRYFPRFVKELKDLETAATIEIKRGVSTRPGARPSSFKERYYEEVLDGMVAGKVYSADLRAAVEMRLTAGNKAISDKMLADFLEPLGRLPKEAIKFELAVAKEEIVNRRVALKQISELIEHINAGAKIDWYRWLGVKKLYPDRYAELRLAAKAKRQVPISLKKFIVTEKKSLTATSKAVLAKYTKEIKRARKPILGKEGQINHAGLQGRLFPVDIAESTNALIRGEITSHQVLSWIAKANDVARQGQTAIDTGFTLIQGLMLLASHPVRWGEAFSIGFKTLANPKYMARWSRIPQHATSKGRIATHGGAEFGRTEFTRAAEAGGWLAKIPGINWLVAKFGTAFNAYLDSARILVHEAKLPHYVRKLGRELTDRELTDLVVTGDHMVGISSLQRLGISNFLRTLSRDTLYAPRYYMAFVSFLGRAFQGGIGGDMARQSLVKFMMAVPAFMTAMAYITGQEERVIPTKDKPIPVMFDPRTGEFMTIELAGTHMGLGGVWIAAFRLLGSLIRTSREDPEDFLSINPHENPILRYGYGRTSPLASGVIDVVTGENYLGERLDTPDDYLKEVVDKTFPFWLAGLITDVPKAGWQKGLAEWWGLRAWMVQYRELSRMHADEHIKDIPENMIMAWQRTKILEGRPLAYDDLNNEQRAWLLLNYEDFREAEEKRREQQKERGTDFQVADAEVKERLDAVYHADLDEIANGVLSGNVAISEYQNQAEYQRRIRNGQYQYRAEIQKIIDEEQWKEFEEWREEHQKPEDVAYDNYMELKGNPPKTFGKPDWDAWKLEVDRFLAGLDTETRDYIERRQDDWINKLPYSAQKIESLIRVCETVLDDYYGYEEPDVRIAYRKTFPEADAKLYILGRVTTLRSDAATLIVQEYSKAWGLPIALPEPEEAKKIFRTPSRAIERGVNPFR